MTEHSSILDGHRGSLGLVGQGRVASVPQERDIPLVLSLSQGVFRFRGMEAYLVPRMQFFMKTKLPFQHRGNSGDDLRQAAVPSFESFSHLANLTLNLVCPRREVVGSDEDKIELRASFKGIKYAVFIGSHPNDNTLSRAELCHSIIVQGK